MLYLLHCCVSHGQCHTLTFWQKRAHEAKNLCWVPSIKIKPCGNATGVTPAHVNPYHRSSWVAPCAHIPHSCVDSAHSDCPQRQSCGCILGATQGRTSPSTSTHLPGGQRHRTSNSPLHPLSVCPDTSRLTLLLGTHRWEPQSSCSTSCSHVMIPEPRLCLLLSCCSVPTTCGYVEGLL